MKKGRRPWRAMLVLALMLPTDANPQNPPIALPWAGRSESPYFEIEGGVPGVDLFPLAETEVDVHVSGVIAAVVVRQVYSNEGERPIHARYVFPASTRAAVHGLRMRIGARVVEAEIREKQVARAEFAQAKKEGRNAALLEQVRPNVFDMRVANVLPGDRVEVELRYTELLVPTEGVYEFVYPTVVGPRYTRAGSPAGDDSGPSSEPWTSTAHLSPGVRAPHAFDIDVTVASGLPVRWVEVPAYQVDTDWSERNGVRVSLREPVGPADRDYVLRYKLADDEVISGLLVSEGEEENYFLLMMEPPDRVGPEHVPPREFVFVVDVSGSMKGFPLETSKELLFDLVEGLRPSDSFNVLLFAGGSKLFSETSLPGTRENIGAARRFIDRERGGGGTELSLALERALALPRRGSVARTIVVATDGFISAEAEAFRLVRERRGNASVFAFGIGSSVNRHLVEGLARAGMSEPFVVTDPTEASAAALRFREYVSSPVLTGIEVDFGGLDVYDVQPRSIPDVLARRPVVVQGKFRGAMPADGRVTLRGTGGGGPYEASFDVGSAPRDQSVALGYLWVRTRIAELSDRTASSVTDETRAEITRLGLEYGLLTRYTSFVAVDRIVRNRDGSAEDVQQPQPLPQGMESPAGGRLMEVGPEPELWLMLLVMAGALLLRRWAVGRVRAARNRAGG